MDLGDPVSYLGLEEGTPVFASDGHELGHVRRVVADANADIFEGLIVEGHGGARFADAEGIVLAMHQRGVVLAVDSAAARDLPVPDDR